MRRMATVMGACCAVLWLAPGCAWGEDFPDNRPAELKPTGGVGDPEYQRRLEEGQRRSAEDARERGESHTDVPISAAGAEGTTVVGPPGAGIAEAEGKTEAPAQPKPKAQVEWPPRQEGTPEGKDDPIPPGAGGREGARVDGYIQVLIEELSRPANMRRIRYVGGEETRPRETAGSVEAGEFQAPLPNVGAGDALYARVLYDVNSDYPGPVMLQILQQPLYGAVARGEFQLIRDRLVVRVTALDVAGETVRVDAVAVGLDCACYGLAGDVTYHWWDRVILPAATGFLENFLIARAQPERRIVEVEAGSVVADERARSREQAIYAGASAAAGQVGRILREQAPSRQTVSIARNTELAVMFVERLGRDRRRGRSDDALEGAEAEALPATERPPVPVVLRGRGELR